MANIKSAAKSARQDVVRAARNSSILTGVKSAQKRFRAAVAGGKTDEAKALLKEVSSELDKAAKRGVIHQNAADRRKSIFGKALKAPVAAA